MAKLFDEMFADDFEKLWAAENAMYIPSYDVEMKYVMGETLNDERVVDGLMEEIERGDYNG